MKAFYYRNLRGATIDEVGDGYLLLNCSGRKILVVPSGKKLEFFELELE